MLRDFEFVTDPTDADILFDSVFDKNEIPNKSWKYKIHFSGESVARFGHKMNQSYNVILSSYGITHPSYVDFPFFAYYLHEKNRYRELECLRPIQKIPTKFCCFIVNNGTSWPRNKMFHLLSQYKTVDSCGSFVNNVEFKTPGNYGSVEYLEFIGQYKFMICFENTNEGTYITEKIVNSFLGRTVPIYHGTPYCKNVFNNNGFLYLENTSDDAYLQLLNRIIELDNNDEQYMAMLNQTSAFHPNFDFDSTYGIDVLSRKIDNALYNSIHTI
jgi:hypothetical protein